MYGYIYLIKDALGFYKIGRTKNVQSRITKYVTENSSLIETIHSYGVFNYIDEEKRLHEKFKGKRLQDKREWFSLDDEDIEYIKSLKDEKEELKGVKSLSFSFGRIVTSKIVDNGYIAFNSNYYSEKISIIEAKGVVILNNFIMGTSFDGLVIYNYSSLCILDKRFNIIEGISASKKFKNDLLLLKNRLLFK